MDRFNNKRDIAHEKKFNMNVMLYDDPRTGLSDQQVNRVGLDHVGPTACQFPPDAHARVWCTGKVIRR
jgi:hypothetical protein